MNADLEATLAELGPEYRPVVNRLVEAYRPLALDPCDAAEGPGRRRARVTLWSVGCLAAASLVAFLGVAYVFRSAEPQPTTRVYTVRASDAAREYTLAVVRNDAAVQEMIRTQRADGSWQNDFLTRRNAEALRTVPGEAARIACKKAERNLRARGLL